MEKSSNGFDLKERNVKKTNWSELGIGQLENRYVFISWNFVPNKMFLFRFHSGVMAKIQ